ncbi:hypothetical protein CONLIGDRAFT_684318 [Coniochaeta ligniaria NRRL 30616]|uniref:Uncharacterized protein n=1 Tax=Coniochaeta ligniaria NRRL 30616 TaxID=1408157 RepID=A0A1J7J7L7_9PEZI|nr:hypothetical protein CONLIGDRAFT_684318 [Coniochaeta ligniaria NRRL 30616]
MLFSFSTEHYLTTYTHIDCWPPGEGTTYWMQDHPADGEQPMTTASLPTSLTLVLSSISTSPAGPIGNPTSMSNATAEPKTNSAGAIAGGVVGGLAVIAILVLGILYILYRRKDAPRPPPLPSRIGQYPPNVAEIQDTSSHVAPNHDSILSEMPGTVPDKALWSPSTNSGGSPVQASNEVHDAHVGARMEIV